MILEQGHQMIYIPHSHFHSSFSLPFCLCVCSTLCCLVGLLKSWPYTARPRCLFGIRAKATSRDNWRSVSSTLTFCAQKKVACSCFQSEMKWQHIAVLSEWWWATAGRGWAGGVGALSVPRGHCHVLTTPGSRLYATGATSIAAPWRRHTRAASNHGNEDLFVFWSCDLCYSLSLPRWRLLCLCLWAGFNLSCRSEIRFPLTQILTCTSNRGNNDSLSLFSDVK